MEREKLLAIILLVILIVVFFIAITMMKGRILVPMQNGTQIDTDCSLWANYGCPEDSIPPSLQSTCFTRSGCIAYCMNTNAKPIINNNCK
ncbi:MAG: hypothetical protein B6U88_01730 [Candidatus Aenigmarchaeota archaeon ex4484_56]|nr:MAG: hypothetical protein B6U88_01730 [Candidatus Aenigmarchaeota archaeon ex4484_56]